MIVGLDLSLTGTGMVRIDKKGKVKSLNIGTKPIDGTKLERYRKIILRIIEESSKYDTFFIEDYAYNAGRGKNSGHRLVDLGELGSVVKTYLWRLVGVEPFSIPQATLCRWFNKGKGSCKKDMKPVAIMKSFDISFDSHDEYIAYAVADFGWHLMGLPVIKRKSIRKDGLLKFESNILADIQDNYISVISPLLKHCHKSFKWENNYGK